MGAKMIGGMVVLAVPVNLLSNPGAELGDASPDDWYASEHTEWSEDARSGAKSLHIAVTAQQADWRAKVFAVTGGEAYKILGWFKGAGGVECYLSIRFWSDAGGTEFVGESNVALDATYADWTLKTGTFTAPANAVSADIMFRCPQNTTVDIYGDDFAVSAA